MKKTALLWVLTIIMITAFMPVTSFGAITHDKETSDTKVQTDRSEYYMCEADIDPSLREIPKKKALSADLIEANKAAHTMLRELMNNYADVEYYKHTIDKYNLTEDQISTMTNVAEKATAKCSTDYEKMKAIYDLVAEEIYYNYDYYDGYTTHCDNDYAAWISGVTVCRGYAELCAIFLNCVDVSCIYVTSQTHAFNAAWDSQDNKWIFFDATWGSRNACLDGKKYYEPHTDAYFDLSVDRISELTHHEYNEKLQMIIEGSETTYNLQTERSTAKWPDTSLWGITLVSQNDKDIETVGIPQDFSGVPVRAIANDAFRGCGNLTGITLPDGLTSIGCFAFYECGKMEGITIPEGVTSIGNLAFDKCKSITHVEIPEGVTTIGVQTFFGCESLERVTLPESLTSIGSIAFGNCTSLQSIAIPDSVTSIGEGAFVSCRALCIYCSEGSAAHSYAVENNVNYKLWKSINDCDVSIEQEEYHITGKPIQPVITVKDGDTTLKEGADYSVSESNTIVGEASVTVAGMGDYVGETEVTFMINDHQWSDSYTTDEEATCTEDGAESIYCTVCGAKKETRPIPPANHDWEETYTTDVAATCSTDGSESIHCRKCDATKDIRVIPATGHDWKHIKNPAGLLKNGSEYDQCKTCGVKQNKVVTTGYANYYVDSFKVIGKKKAFKAEWKKQSEKNQKKFNGYQIRYSTKSDMSNAKTATAKNSSESKKIKELKKNKKYYVQVRTYTKSNGITFYSKWSEKKAVKTK